MPPNTWREDRVRFWAAIATGVLTDEASKAAGVSAPVGHRWFRHAGGVNPQLSTAVSDRYLSFIALLHAQGLGVRAIARRLGRTPRRFPGSCAATHRLGHTALTTKPQSRNGMPNGVRSVPRSPHSRSTNVCGTTPAAPVR